MMKDRTKGRHVWVRALFILLSFGEFQSNMAATTDISGNLETEIGKQTDISQVNSSSINQATVEVNFHTEINSSVSSNIILLYEDNGANPLNVDAAFVRLNPAKSPWSLQFGLQYLPFGWMQTYMVSDPFTLELAETSDTSFLLAYENKYYGKFYIANGSVKKYRSDGKSEEKIGQFGVSFGYVSDESADSNIDIGFDYTNNIGDTNKAGELIAQDPKLPEFDVGGNGDMQKYIPGGAAHLGLKFSQLHLLAELVYASEKFQSPEIRRNDAKPSAANVEFAVDFGKDSTVALGFQNSVDMEDFGLPAKRVLLTYRTLFSNAIGMGLELRSDQDYPDTGLGSGKTGRGFTLQFSAGF